MPRCPQNPGRRSPARPCWSGTGHSHSPEYPHVLSCRRVPRTDSQLPPSLSRVTPSAVSEHFSELLGCPISRSLTTSCVGLELRPLPSPSITRLHRYYGPLRHPSAPGLSLTGVRLIILITHWGFPCCVRFPCVHAAATTPVQRLGVVLAHLTQSCQPSPEGAPGRPAHRSFRGLLGVHSRCGLHTRAVTN